MKEQLFFTGMLFFFVTILACTQQPTNTLANTNAHNDLQSLDTTSGEIDSAKAIAYIKVWDNLRPGIKAALVKGGAPNDTSKVPISFYVPIQDILSLAKKSAKTDQLYAVLAIEDSTKLSLIFRAPDDKGVTRYYDFTMPCPPCDVSKNHR